MQRPKIYSLFDDPTFGLDMIDCDTGLVITEQEDCALYAIVVFEDRVEAYVNICDDEAPYRNYMGEGVAATEEEAKKLAMEALHRQAYDCII